MIAPAQAYISHQAPGRLRLKVPERRRDRSYFNLLQERLAGMPGVTGAEANPLTGSILVRYDPRRFASFDAAALSDLLVVGPPAASRASHPVPLMDRIESSAAVIDRRLKGWSAGAVDLRAAGVVGLALMGFGQLLRGNIVAPAATLLWYAADLARPRLARRANREQSG